VSNKTTAFARVLDQIGLAICSDELTEDAVLTVDAIVELTGASRSIVREATRVLSAIGLVEARQRVGVRVLPQHRWNVLDARVVRWRLASPGRARQTEDLLELRAAIEPQAARLAAGRRDQDQAQRLADLAVALRDAALSEDSREFSARDADFHRTLLEASGNSAFSHLAAVIEAAVIDREEHSRGGEPYDPIALELHAAVAGHILAGRATEAESAMLGIIERTRLIDKVHTMDLL
jgi:DNA-binding FadR family transcriptional regulator